jgi:hypothetical protein
MLEFVSEMKKDFAVLLTNFDIRQIPRDRKST